MAIHWPLFSEKIFLHRQILMVAPPGTGKTTVLPKLIYTHAQFPSEQEIIILEPRRVAAKLAALRVASLFNEKIGETVGYSFRNETVESPQTKIKFFTEGTLVRRLLRQPDLKGVHMILLDEFHERSLQGDLALALLKRLQVSLRPDLKIIVMSATPEMQSLRKFLPELQVIDVPVPIYDLEVDYWAFQAKENLPLPFLVKKALERVLITKKQGDILIFFPGWGDIQRSLEECNEMVSRFQLDFIILHGDLSPQEQMRAFTRHERRKVIFSTNIAESSVTVDGVSIVIDSGLFKESQTSIWSGVRELITKKISQSSARQRAGRANRQSRGYCLRLYTKEDFDSRVSFSTPEIQRTDLSQTLLDLKCLGVRSIENFDWFERPPESEIMGTCQWLWQLGAFVKNTTSSEMTDLGKKLAVLPMSPRWGRSLLAAQALGVQEEVAELLVSLEQNNARTRSTEIFALSELFEDLKIQRKSMHFQNEKERILRSLKNIENNEGSERHFENSSAVDRISFSLLLGFLDHVAQLQKSSSSWKLTLQSGETSQAFRDRPSEKEWFIVMRAKKSVDIRFQQKSLVVQICIPISTDWLGLLNPSPFKEVEEYDYEESQDQVFHTYRMVLGNLTVLQDQNVAHGPIATQIYFQKSLGFSFRDDLSLEELLIKLVSQIKNKKNEKTSLHHEKQWVRWLLLHRYGRLGGVLIKASDLLSLYQNCLGYQDLESWSLVEAWATIYGQDLRLLFEEQVPDKITLPLGRKVEINYKLGLEPWGESRMQDFFGMRLTPSLLQGQLSLKIHLLAPNGRAVQVTQDLMSFWQKTYPEVRKELMRRYPKHSWPESPL